MKTINQFCDRHWESPPGQFLFIFLTCLVVGSTCYMVGKADGIHTAMVHFQQQEK